MKGARTGRVGLNLIIFTVDDSSMDMMFEGKFRGDSLLMTSVRPRSGKNVLPWGSWLVFVNIQRHDHGLPNKRLKLPARVGY